MKGEVKVMKKNLPQIEASFAVVGKEFSLTQLTEALGILPTETRTRKDWPKAIIENKNLPEEFRPRCEWSITKKEDACLEVEVPIQKIISQLRGKGRTLNEFCKKNNLEKSLLIVIHAKKMRLPAIYLSAQTVSYLGKLGVEIGFDMYVY